MIGLGLFFVFILLGNGLIPTSIIVLKPNLYFLSLYFFSTLLLLIISGLRWGYLVTELTKVRVCSYFDYFFYHVMGRFSSQYVSQIVGDLFIKPGALKKVKGVALDKAVSASFIDKCFDFIVIVAFIIPSALYFLDIVSTIVAVFIVFTFLFLLSALVIFKGAAVVSYVEAATMKSENFLRRFLFTKKLFKSDRSEKIQKLEYANSLSGQSLMLIITLSIVRYLILVLSVYFLSKSFGLNISPVIFFMGTPVAQLSMFFAFTPGALGFLEGGWYAVLILSGITRSDITVFLLGQRAYLFIAIGGIFLVSLLLFEVKRLIFPDKIEASEGGG